MEKSYHFEEFSFRSEGLVVVEDIDSIYSRVKDGLGECNCGCWFYFADSSQDIVKRL